MPKISVGQAFYLIRTHQTVVAICVTTAVTMMGQGIISPILPLLAKEYGVSLALVGVTVGIFGLGRVLVNVPTGVVAERFGRRWVLVGGLVVLAASSAAMALTRTFAALVLLRFFSGIGSAMYITGAMITLTDISTPANRGQYISYQQGSILLGTGLGPAVGGLAAEVWGLRSTFYMLAVLSVAGLAWAALRMPETKGASAPGLTATGSRAEVRVGTPTRAQGNFLAALLDFNTLIVGFYFFMVVFTRNGARSSIIPLLGNAQAHLGPGQLGLAFSAMVLLNFALVIPAGVLSDKLGRKALMLPGALVTAASLAAYMGSTNFLTFLLASLVMGLGTGIVGPSPVAFVADLAPPGSQAMAIGLFRTYGDMGGVVGPVLLGWMVDISGYGTALIINAMLVLASAAFVALLARERVRVTASR